MVGEKKRILQITAGGTEFTGVCGYILQYYENIDRSRFCFDLLFCLENSMGEQSNNPIFSDSCFFVLNAYKKRSKSFDYYSILKKVRHIIDENDYDIVEINTSRVELLFVCVLAVRLSKKKPLIISHSHNSQMGNQSGTRIRLPIRSIIDRVENDLRKYIVKKSDYLLACSINAGQYAFGEGCIDSPKFAVVKNAIKVAKYIYNPQIRQTVRSSFGIDDEKLVVGHVGRLSKLKNHDMLLRVFSIIHKEMPDSVLLLVGDGPEKSSILSSVKKMDLEGCVILAGERRDVADCLQAMDVFVFPSLAEGLGIAAIEAQASGLPTIISDAVPQDAVITPKTQRLSLTDGLDVWANHVMNAIQEKRVDTSPDIRNAGYDIDDNVNKLENFYNTLVSRRNHYEQH